MSARLHSHCGIGFLAISLLVGVVWGQPKGVDDAPFVEIEIAGVAINDAASTVRFFQKHGEGTRIDDGAKHRLFSNDDGSQVLDLVSHSGSVENEIDEIRVIEGDVFPLAGDRTDISKFATKRGLTLGMSPDEVSKLY